MVIEAAAPRAAVQISAPGIDAAEPATVSAGRWNILRCLVNHGAKQGDVMIARFGSDGGMQGSPAKQMHRDFISRSRLIKHTHSRRASYYRRKQFEARPR